MLRGAKHTALAIIQCVRQADYYLVRCPRLLKAHSHAVCAYYLLPYSSQSGHALAQWAIPTHRHATRSHCAAGARRRCRPCPRCSDCADRVPKEPRLRQGTVAAAHLAALLWNHRVSAPLCTSLLSSACHQAVPRAVLAPLMIVRSCRVTTYCST